MHVDRVVSSRPEANVAMLTSERHIFPNKEYAAYPQLRVWTWTVHCMQHLHLAKQRVDHLPFVHTRY
jgi:hypothetical protein